MTITIAIAGGPASGKKTVQKALQTHLLTAHPDLHIQLAHLADFHNPAHKEPYSPGTSHATRVQRERGF
jgi:uridine kinase